MIKELLHEHIKNSHAQREENLDLNNLMFHRKYGMSIQLPSNWSYMDALLDVLNTSSQKKSLIIFPSTVMYHTIYKRVEDEGLGGNLSYVSWHEIYTGMQMTSSDVRHMQRTKALLMDSELTFFLDPPPMVELVDQVRGHTNGCLMVLSRGDGNV